MSQPLQSVNGNLVSNEQSLSIHSFLNQSASKQLSNSVDAIHDGLHMLKDEFSSLCSRTGDAFHYMLSPVNNFLKDFTQMEKEFQTAGGSEPTRLGNVVPIEVALLSPMEENY